MPQQNAFGEDAYPTIPEAAMALPSPSRRALLRERRVAKLAGAAGLKLADRKRSSGFDSQPGHQHVHMSKSPRPAMGTFHPLTRPGRPAAKHFAVTQE